MQIRARWRMPAIESWIVVLGSYVAMSCSFEHGKLCQTLEELPVTPLMPGQPPSPVINADGVLHVIHGKGCGRRNDGQYTSDRMFVRALAIVPMVGEHARGSARCCAAMHLAKAATSQEACGIRCTM